MPPLMSPVRISLLTAALAVVCASSSAQEQILKHDYERAGDTSVEIQSIFGTAARHGALPFRVIIRNNTGSDRVWTVRLNEGYSGRKLRTESTYRFAVENASEVEHGIVFQFGPSFAAYDFRNLEIVVSSPGLKTVNRNHGEQTNQSFPFLAISKPLAQKSLSALDDAVEKGGSNDHYFAKPFDPAFLPSDWLGYTALDFLLLDLESWTSLQVIQRKSILSWVRLGGNLEVYIPDGGTLDYLDIESLPLLEDAKSARLSLGTITVRGWFKGLLPESTIKRYESHTTRSAELDGSYGSNWTLAKALDPKDFNPVLIFILLAAFAIIVAPVNLFIFAKSGQRHRLFITTPIISVVACLLIVAFIFFKDGLGGQGLRVVFADLQSEPGEMQIYTTQEQVSRTGVMMNSGFENESQLALDPVKLPDSAFNALSGRSRRSTVYNFSGNDFSGGFFRSRSEQGFAIENAQPTRSRVELIAKASDNAPPQLVSNLAFPIREFFYLGEGDTIWQSEAKTTVAPGNIIPLTAVSRLDFENWFDRNMDGYSIPLGKKVRDLRSEPNRFFAIPVNPSDLTIPTHPSIEWENRAILLSGKVLNATPASDE